MGSLLTSLTIFLDVQASLAPTPVSLFVADMEVDMVADMMVDMVTNMEVDNPTWSWTWCPLSNMEVAKVADMELDMMASIELR